MAADPWTLCNGTAKLIADGSIPIDSGAFKIALYTVWNQITAASTVYVATNEHANQGAPGYETAGKTCPLTTATVTTNDVAITQDAVVEWTATGGNIVAQQAVLYYDGATKYILAFAALDTGHGNVTATTGNKLQIGGTSAAVINVTVT